MWDALHIALAGIPAIATREPRSRAGSPLSPAIQSSATRVAESGAAPVELQQSPAPSNLTRSSTVHTTYDGHARVHRSVNRMLGSLLNVVDTDQ